MQNQILNTEIQISKSDHNHSKKEVYIHKKAYIPRFLRSPLKLPKNDLGEASASSPVTLVLGQSRTIDYFFIDSYFFTACIMSRSARLHCISYAFTDSTVVYLVDANPIIRTDPHPWFKLAYTRLLGLNPPRMSLSCVLSHTSYAFITERTTALPACFV